MKTIQLKVRLLAACVFAIAASAFGLGADYENDHPVGGASGWPEGLKELVNTTNRVHGYFVNAEDVFFFSGSATNLTEFLRDYSKIQGIEKHQLILHEGTGAAKSPWSKASKPCDWKLYAVPKSWLAGDGKEKSFILEVHFWTGDKIALDQVAVPRNVEFAGSYLKVFQSITNGMTRAEVEGKFKLDGGLQGASPVRFVHPNCPMFKVNVEFDFKRKASDQNRAVIGKDDKVIRVSKPYMERPFMD
ncbi:MAG: hypothetical protein H7Y43_17860 [Akkermansiaceae bacterium]|nr:hypothetical protein [Verrucomicrobiales bacterium]